MFTSRIKTPTDTAADVSEVTTDRIMFVLQNMKLGKPAGRDGIASDVSKNSREKFYKE